MRPVLPPKRHVGDDGLFFQVVDSPVHAGHQARDLGKRSSRLGRPSRPNRFTGACVGLIADREAHRLYAQCRFEPTAPRAIGMAFSIE